MRKPARRIGVFLWRSASGLRRAIEERPAAWAAAGLTLFAAAIRLAYVDYGLPYIYHWDEPGIVNAAREMLITGKFWPPFFYTYPSLIIDLQALTSVFSYLKALESYPAYVDISEIPVHYFYLAGRIVQVAFGVLGVWWTYLFAARVWRKRWWGVAAAALVAVSHHNIFISRIIGVEVPLATLSLAAVYFLFRYRQLLRRRDFWLSAVFLGLAAGAKHNAFILVLPVGLALAAWRRPLRDYFIYAGVVFGVFLATTPGAIFNMHEFLSCLGRNYHHYKVEGFDAFTSEWPLLYSAKLAWDFTMTPAPSLLAAAGVVVVLARYRREGLLFLLFPITFAAAISEVRIGSPRFIIDIFPFVALSFGAAFGLAVELCGRLPRRELRLGVIIVLAAATFYLPARGALLGFRAWAKEPPPTSAAHWVLANVPWPAVVVKEVWNDRPFEEGGETDAAPVDVTKYRLVKVDWITRKTLAEWADTGAVYFVGHLPPEDYPGRSQYADGAMDGVEGDAEGFWRHFERVAFFAGDANWPGLDPMTVYRFDDELLVARHPYRRFIPLEECLAVREAWPHEPLPIHNGWIQMYWNGRVGCFFTAPPGPYRLGFRLRGVSANGVWPRVSVAVDGERVAEFDVTKGRIYWTPTLEVGARRYRHLLLRYANDEENLAGGDRNVVLGEIIVKAMPAGGAAAPVPGEVR